MEKDEFKMQVRRELEEMDVGGERDGETFERNIEGFAEVAGDGEDGGYVGDVGGNGRGGESVRKGVCGIWVEEVEVRGLRN